MPLRPFVRRASTTTDGELIIQKPPPVRRHSSVQIASPQLPPIPKVSPLLDPNEQDRLVHSDDSTAASSRYSGGSSLLDGGRRYGSADEGTVLTTASSVEDETGKLSPPPPLFTQRFAPTTLARDAGPNNLREAWFVSAPLAPVPVEDVILADEDDNDADDDEDDDGVVYIDNESSDEEDDEEEPSAADHDDDLVLTCGCDGGAASRLPPPVTLPEGQLPWTFPRRGTGSSGTLREALADPDEDDPALIEAERILLTTPEPTEGVFSSPRSSLNISPRSIVPAGPTKRPSLPLPELPFPTIKKNGSAVPGSSPRPEHAFERRLERLVLNSSESDDDDAGEETEVEAGRRKPTAAAPRVALAAATVPPARPPRRRPNKLHKRRRSSSAGGISGGEGRPKKPPFDRFSFPTEQGMASALECEIATESGEAVKFGDMLRERKHDKVVVIFLRHAWCGLCQQYVEALNRASLNLVSITGNMFADLGGEGGRTTTSRIVPLDVVLINSSTPALIGPYRQRHHTPFPLFSDRRRKLYKALGMTRKTWDMGKDADKGSYIVKSQMHNVTSSISAGVKMPKYPGSQTQLGGEFVFEHDRKTDSFKCLFVSRMHNTRAHAEIRDVFAAAGVELDEQDAASVYGA